MTTSPSRMVDSIQELISIEFRILNIVLIFQSFYDVLNTCLLLQRVTTLLEVVLLCS